MRRSKKTDATGNRQRLPPRPLGAFLTHGTGLSRRARAGNLRAEPEVRIPVPVPISKSLTDQLFSESASSGLNRSEDRQLEAYLDLHGIEASSSEERDNVNGI